MLIGHAHSSQFMEQQNLGIRTLKYAKCAPNFINIFHQVATGATVSYLGPNYLLIFVILLLSEIILFSILKLY